jgi:UDP-N-acetylmuramate-alanine ligase
MSEKIDFSKPCHVHFIGIGGISMSGLAEILIDRHFTVSGSDRAPSGLTEHLEKMGAEISFPQNAGNVTDDIDMFVYTSAIHPDNPEFAAALATGQTGFEARRTSGTDHGALQKFRRRRRHSWQDHYHFNDKSGIA